MNKKPYSDRRWYDADFETVMNLKPLKHSEEYKKNAKEFFSGLFGREFAETQTCKDGSEATKIIKARSLSGMLFLSKI
ncbi:hypothetical protein [Ligilactobacillus ruminis]|uniref:hypothetical protein n=1 Tax=Ligilactobacillus ruminis TaxID=1623 RepID=UPI00062CC68F|nr:hypothetical protein [Ligilactobacillus ruminis]KLA48710.1 hypothetical protein P869_02440 [Ligilactobacillus ruminis S23]MBT9627814.1 hypothetical protein [Ligilactobacillus ruminis]